jgi:hypothetical protein
MGKAAKEHRKKVQARNNKIKQQKTKMENMQREFLMNLIKQEQEKGMFENNPSLNGPIVGDGPMFDGQSLSDRFDFGSMIDGPVIDGPVIDGDIIDTPMIDVPVETKEEETNTTTEVVSESDKVVGE